MRRVLDRVAPQGRWSTAGGDPRRELRQCRRPCREHGSVFSEQQRLDDRSFAIVLRRHLADAEYYVKLALDNTMAGKPLENASTKPYGCRLSTDRHARAESEAIQE